MKKRAARMKRKRQRSTNGRLYISVKRDVFETFQAWIDLAIKDGAVSSAEFLDVVASGEFPLTEPPKFVGRVTDYVIENGLELAFEGVTGAVETRVSTEWTITLCLRDLCGDARIRKSVAREREKLRARVDG